MKNLIDILCYEFATPEGRDLQERCLESMILVERFRGVGNVDSLCPGTLDSDISPHAIEHLADALAAFVANFPSHADVGSATWALGKVGRSRFTSLFERIVSNKGAYDDFARRQAMIALQDLEVSFCDC